MNSSLDAAYHYYILQGAGTKECASRTNAAYGETMQWLQFPIK